MYMLKFIFYMLLLCFNFVGAEDLASTLTKSESLEQCALVGTHVIAEFLGCEVPEDQPTLEKIMRDAAKESKSTDLEFVMHNFKPKGVTAILILAESHISVHSWPEKKYAAVDAFTCGKSDPSKAIEYLKKAFKASAAKISIVGRGMDSVSIEQADNH